MLGFMLTTAFISMWITNTATTAMMTPIMEAVLKELDKEYLEEEVDEPVEDEDNMNVTDVEARMQAKEKEANNSGNEVKKEMDLRHDEIELGELGLQTPSRSTSTRQLVDQ